MIVNYSEEKHKAIIIFNSQQNLCKHKMQKQQSSLSQFQSYLIIIVFLHFFPFVISDSCCNFMFKRFFQSEEESATKSKSGTNSSTSGTDDLEEKMDPKQEYQQFLVQSNKLAQELTFKLSDRKDEYRHRAAYEDGGITCDDPRIIDKMRSVGKEMIKLIGRKILSGSFNLAKISFPIRACYPKSALYNSVACCEVFPYFLNNAAKMEDPMERFKLVVSCFLSTPYYLDMFLKPLNPILGQTLQGSLIDGTKIYAEQVSHHPPISYFLIIGPGECYRYSGYYDFDISPGLNSLTLKNKGKRVIQFKDGTRIEGTYATNEFSGTFIGTTRIEELERCRFEDKTNGILCQVQFDKVKKRPSDYFQSFILVKNKKAVHMFGTYCGYIEFDGVRYWDGRDVQPLYIELKKEPMLLPSDWSYRVDIIELLKGEKAMEEAQKSKQVLEELQRHDVKLRNKSEQFWGKLKQPELEKKQSQSSMKKSKSKDQLKKNDYF